MPAGTEGSPKLAEEVTTVAGRVDSQDPVSTEVLVLVGTGRSGVVHRRRII